MVPKNVIDLSDDDPLDHPHSSDDDKDPGKSVAPYEKKPTLLPDGKVKVEGDWWTYENEKREKRIARDRQRRWRYGSARSVGQAPGRDGS